MKKKVVRASMLAWLAFLAGCAPDGAAESDEEEVATADEALLDPCHSAYYMRAASSHLCVAPVSNSISQPSWIGQYECVCPTNAKIQWLPLPIGYSPSMVVVQTAHTNVYGQQMCIDRPNGSTATHLPLQSYPCHAGPSQQWSIRAVSYGGGKYWQYEAAYYDANNDIVRTGQCIDIPNNSMSIGTIFQLYPCKTTSDPDPRNQLFEALW